MPRYEIVQDFDGVEHVMLRVGDPFEHEPVCDDLDEPCFEGPEPEMCAKCRDWIAHNGDREALERAVAGGRARWLAALPAHHRAAPECDRTDSEGEGR